MIRHRCSFSLVGEKLIERHENQLRTLLNSRLRTIELQNDFVNERHKVKIEIVHEKSKKKNPTEYEFVRGCENRFEDHNKVKHSHVS